MSIHEPIVEIHPDTHLRIEALFSTVRTELEHANAVEFRAAALHALLCAYHHRYLLQATADLRVAVEALAEAGTARSAAVAELAPLLRLAPEATLRELAAACPEPYREELLRLRDELFRTSERVASLEADNVETLGAQMALVEEVLSGLGGDGGVVYGREAPSAPRMLRGVW